MAPEVGEHINVYSRARHHGKNFPGRGLYSHHAAFLALHQLLAVLLQVRIDGGGNILARNGLHVIIAIVIRVFLAAAGVAPVDMPSFAAAKFGLAGRLQTGAAVIIAGLVVWMLLQKLRTYLGDVSQKVSAGIEWILPQASHLRLEARKQELLLGKAHVGLGAYHLKEGQRLPAYLGAVGMVVGHPLAHKVGGGVKRRGKRQGVKLPHLPWGDQDLVAYLIAYQQLAVAVVDNSAGRINHFAGKRVVVGVGFIALVKYLHIEKAPQQNEKHHGQADEQFGGAVVVFHALTA